MNTVWRVLGKIDHDVFARIGTADAPHRMKADKKSLGLDIFSTLFVSKAVNLFIGKREDEFLDLADFNLFAHDLFGTFSNLTKIGGAAMVVITPSNSDAEQFGCKCAGSQSDYGP
jgi:hypothetical protein